MLSQVRDFCLDIAVSSVFTFNADLIREVQIKTNQNALCTVIILKVHLCVWLSSVKMYSYISLHNREARSAYPVSSPVKTSNLPDKCPMTGADL